MVLSELILSRSWPFNLVGQTSSHIHEFKIDTPSSASSFICTVSQYWEGVRPPPNSISCTDISQSHNQVSEPEVVSSLETVKVPTDTLPAVFTLLFTSPCSTSSTLTSGIVAFWNR